MRTYPTLMETYPNPKNKGLKMIKSLPDCVVAVIDGKDITVLDLLNLVNAQNDRIDLLQNKLDELGLKYNALNAAYKANTAKVAMQILENKETN